MRKKYSTIVVLMALALYSTIIPVQIFAESTMYVAVGLDLSTLDTNDGSMTWIGSFNPYC